MAIHTITMFCTGIVRFFPIIRNRLRIFRDAFFFSRIYSKSSARGGCFPTTVLLVIILLLLLCFTVVSSSSTYSSRKWNRRSDLKNCSSYDTPVKYNKDIVYNKQLQIFRSSSKMYGHHHNHRVFVFFRLSSLMKPRPFVQSLFVLR